MEGGVDGVLEGDYGGGFARKAVMISFGRHEQT
jgi:hypothetical protein